MFHVTSPSAAVLATALAATAVVLAPPPPSRAVGPTGTTAATPAAQKPRAQLTVTGLAAGLTARLRLVGPAGKRRTVRIRAGTQPLRGLTPGSWQLCRQAVRTKRAVFVPDRACATLQVARGTVKSIELGYDARYRRGFLRTVNLQFAEFPPRTRATLLLSSTNGVQRRVTVTGTADPANPTTSTLTGLAVGAYRVQLLGLRTPFTPTVRGAILPSDTRLLVGRARAITHQVEFIDLAAVVRGRAVDPAGQPVSGLPVCGVSASFGAELIPDCRAVTGATGEFRIRLGVWWPRGAPIAWEGLQLGTNDVDLPWRTYGADLSRPVPEAVTMQPRGEISGVVGYDDSRSAAGLRVCGAYQRFHFRPYFERETAVCTVVDSAGGYRIRLDEGRSQIYVDQPAVTAAYRRAMAEYLAAPDSEWPVQPPVRDDPTFSRESGATVAQRLRVPGQTLDLNLTTVGTGEAITLQGAAGLPDADVCAVTLAGSKCTRTDAAGALSLTVPTLVPTAEPTAAVRVKLVLRDAAAGTLTVDRFTAVPGSTVERDSFN